MGTRRRDSCSPKADELVETSPRRIPYHLVASSIDEMGSCNEYEYDM